MKNRVLSGLLLLSLIFASALAPLTALATGTMEDSGLEAAIIRDYNLYAGKEEGYYTADNLPMDILGSFSDGSTVVRLFPFDRNWMTVVTTVTVGEYYLVSGDSNVPRVYKNNTFYDLTKAYEEGVITTAILKEMYAAGILQKRGTEVPFTVGAGVNIHSSSYAPKFAAKPAQTLSELQEIYANDPNPNQYNYISKYDEAFFEDNAVIVLFITENSGGIRHVINSLVKDGSDILIDITKDPPVGTTDDMAYWRYVLEVKKSDIEGVENYRLASENDIPVIIPDIIRDYTIYRGKSEGYYTSDNLSMDVWDSFSDGSMLVRMFPFDTGAYQVVTTVNVGNYYLTSPDSNVPLFYKNNTFYDLRDAYVDGIITDDTLDEMYTAGVLSKKSVERSEHGSVSSEALAESSEPSLAASETPAESSKLGSVSRETSAEISEPGLVSSKLPAESSKPDTSGDHTNSSKLEESRDPTVSGQPQPEQHSIVMRLNSTKALLDGEEIAVDPTNTDVAPFTLNSKTMVPVRFVQRLGAEVKYTSEKEPVTVSYGNVQLTLKFDDPIMKKKVGNNAPIDISLPTAPTMVEGKTCVPIREIAEGLGLSISYNSANFVIVASTTELSPAELATKSKEGENLQVVVEGVRSITAKKPSVLANIGDTIQIAKADITFVPAKVGCGKLVYSSDNNAVATVTSQGLIKAVSKGTAKITVSSHNGKRTVITVLSGASEAESKVQAGIQNVYDKVGTDLYDLYKWTRDNITYVTMSTHPPVPEGYTREQMYAVMGLEEQRGNCFVFAATFTALARGLGYNVTYVEGEVPAISGGFTRHGFVIIEIDGAKYICDPELEYKYTSRNLYMQPINAPKTNYRWPGM